MSLNLGLRNWTAYNKLQDDYKQYTGPKKYWIIASNE